MLLILLINKFQFKKLFKNYIDLLIKLSYLLSRDVKCLIRMNLVIFGNNVKEF